MSKARFLLIWSVITVKVMFVCVLWHTLHRKQDSKNNRHKESMAITVFLLVRNKSRCNTAPAQESDFETSQQMILLWSSNRKQMNTNKILKQNYCSSFCVKYSKCLRRLNMVLPVIYQTFKCHDTHYVLVRFHYQVCSLFCDSADG